MYEAFYGLTENPFNTTPDPKFLYLSEHHEEGLAHLLYGVDRKKGLIVLTGEIGTGKTTLLNSLVHRLDERTHFAFLVDSQVNIIDIFQFAFHEFGLGARNRTKGEFLIELKNFLTTCATTKENVVLILDESQNLSIEVLEGLRLLTNFETEKEKLLQIILVGQPLLNGKLNLPELAQLKQRIGVNYRLTPLNRLETKGYIETRLTIAGAAQSMFKSDAIDAISTIADTPHSIFKSEAIDVIYAYSEGVPRIINIICDLALFFGYTDKKRDIGRTVIQQAAESLHINEPEDSMERDGDRVRGRDRADAIVIKQARGDGMQDVPRHSYSAESSEPVRPRPARRGLRRPAWFVIVVCIGIVFGLVVGEWFTAWQFPTSEAPPSLPGSGTPLPTKTVPNLLPAVPPRLNDSQALFTPWGERTGVRETSEARNDLHQGEGQVGKRHDPVNQPSASTGKEDRIDLENVVQSSRPGPRTGGAVSEQLGSSPIDGHAAAQTVVIVQAGDTLTKIMRNIYGQFDSNLLPMIQEANPDLTDFSLIEVGQRIVLPPLPKRSRTPLETRKQ